MGNDGAQMRLMPVSLRLNPLAPSPVASFTWTILPYAVRSVRLLQLPCYALDFAAKFQKFSLRFTLQVCRVQDKNSKCVLKLQQDVKNPLAGVN